MSSTSTPPATDFSGLWIPIVTPFDAKRAVDHAALAALVRRLVAQGIAGIVACGSTGEAAALDTQEQRAVLETVLAAQPGLRVVMGVSDHHFGHASAWVRELAAYPLAGLLICAPHYIRPSQAGLLQWFRRLADAAAAPVMLYDIPYRTGARIECETLLALARHPNIQALKDCGGELAKTLAVLDQGDLQVLAGEDLQIFSTLAQGGAGMVTASAHLRTADFVRLNVLMQAGEMAGARTLWRTLVPLIEAVFAEPNPAPLKAALAHQGLLHDMLRDPMTPCSQAHAACMRDLVSTR